ncbi:MAG: diheme cytochrome c [Gammaproteobacteria bacterium]|nr:diheme cytochrome c [Gammaproteobacteria bacterium]
MPARLFLVVMIGFLVLSALMRTRDENISPVNHALTDEECSACHLAFPAAMLPSTSWARLMSSLASHFGDDASLDEDSVTAITTYLNSNSADSSWLGNRFSRGQTNDWPIRITETDHWLREHKNQSFKNPLNFEEIIQSDCVACHDNAAKGDFRFSDA